MGTIRLGRKEFEERAEQEVVAAAEPQGEIQKAEDTAETEASTAAKLYPYAKGRVRSEERKGLLARDAAILFEDEKRRGRNTKFYRKNNGTICQIISNYPMHYETAEGLQEIDNTLEDKGERFETRAGKYKIGVAKTTKQDGTLKFSDGEVSIEWNYLPEGDTMSEAVEQRTDDGLEYKKQLNKVVYGEASPATDIEYNLEGENVKENIIVREKKEEYRYRFELNLTGVEPRISDDGMKIEFYKPSNEKVAEIPAPYMYDAAGARSEDVYYELEEEEGKYAFTVVADPQWINDEERTMPVTIDPQIVTGGSSFLSVTTYKKVYNKSTKRWESAGSYSSTSEIVSSRSTQTELTTEVKVDLKKTNMLGYPTLSVILRLCAKNQSTIAYVDGQAYAVNNGKVEIELKNKLVNGKCTLYFGIPYASCDMRFEVSSAQVEVEYATDETVRLCQKQFAPIEGLAVNCNLYSGEIGLAFGDTNEAASLLGFRVEHAYSINNDDFHCGKYFRMNIDETLECSENGGHNTYIYTDAFGQKHCFKEVYYYKNGEENIYIDDITQIKFGSDLV